MHIVLHARMAADTALPLNIAVFHACILVYSSFWSKQPIMQMALKSNPFSRFQMAFSLSSFSVCCALCVFLINQVKLQAMHHSLSSVSRKWMVTWSFTRGFCMPFPQRTSTAGEQASRGEQQRKIRFRVSAEKFICDINIWYLKHGCVCVHQDKVDFKIFPGRAAESGWVSKAGGGKSIAMLGENEGKEIHAAVH